MALPRPRRWAVAARVLGTALPPLAAYAQPSPSCSKDADCGPGQYCEIHDRCVTPGAPPAARARAMLERRRLLLQLPPVIYFGIGPEIRAWR